MALVTAYRLDAVCMAPREEVRRDGDHLNEGERRWSDVLGEPSCIRLVVVEGRRVRQRLWRAIAPSP
jgi:hypothetical protein